MTSGLERFKALSFDCYGTLIDWERGIVTALRPWVSRNGLEVTDENLLSTFAAIETKVQNRHRPAVVYPRVLAETLREMGQRLGAEVSDEEAEAFGGSIGKWPEFPDSARSLQRLAERYLLIVVSNVDRTSFQLSNDRLGVPFRLVITAEDVGSYKPHLGHFRTLLAELAPLGVQRSELLHVAQSLFHDHVPAKELGLPTVWIDRRSSRSGFGATPAPPVEVTPEWYFPSLAGFADAALGPAEAVRPTPAPACAARRALRSR